MALRSERLRKYERELSDLEKWMKLGLVPKKDIDKHNDEIGALKAKIKEEKERLQFLKESDEVEEYVAPKTSTSRPAFSDVASMSDLDMEHGNNSNFDVDNEVVYFEQDSNHGKEERTTSSSEDSDVDSFSDGVRSRRNGWEKYILDPDSDDW